MSFDTTEQIIFQVCKLPRDPYAFAEVMSFHNTDENVFKETLLGSRHLYRILESMLGQYADIEESVMSAKFELLGFYDEHNTCAFCAGTIKLNVEGKSVIVTLLPYLKTGKDGLLENPFNTKGTITSFMQDRNSSGEGVLLVSHWKKPGSY